MARKDYLLDENNDFATENGDFITDVSDFQHVSLLCQLNKGELKESPTIGVGLNNFVKKQNTNLSEIKRQIKVGLLADSYKVKDITVDSDGSFKLDYELEE